MVYLLIFAIGYFLGCISPASVLARRKQVDLRKEGSGNLGATNTALVLGRSAGAFVMTVDILKSVVSAKVAKLVFPSIVCAGLIASLGCIVGHCFPVFLDFQGGKGLASFGGMILAYKPLFFVMIAVPAVILMLLLNTSVAVPILSGLLFPILVGFHSHDLFSVLISAAAGALIVFMHRDNLYKALTDTDVISARDYWKKVIRRIE